MAFKITNEPKPKGRSKYPFMDMKINDTFIVPNIAQATIGSSAKYWETKTGFKFSTSKVEGGIKVRRES